ncbi:MAG: hypothetical protein LUF30_04915, partial [Lachnospiraceae bacterium]|nr:hypothetical protein [Lachnospiraceae bacterium]
RDYLDFYAEAMALAGERYLQYWKAEVIVPIPMHWKKRAARGYNQSELLAERISRLTGIPCEKKMLRCVRYTGNQKELGRGERRKNLRGSFEAESPGGIAKDKTALSDRKCLASCRDEKEKYQNWQAPSRVLLIDDVYTTGSTMDEAARALRAAGVRQIYFLVLCTGKGKKSLHDTKSVLY